jgi:hypothetical protein
VAGGGSVKGRCSPLREMPEEGLPACLARHYVILGTVFHVELP